MTAAVGATRIPVPQLDGEVQKRVAPTNLVIFGATGDLAQRKLLPAIYNLAADGSLPERFHLLGVSRAEMSDQEFRAFAVEAVRAHSRREPDQAVLDRLFQSARYVAGTFDEDGVYGALQDALDGLDEAVNQRMNRCFHLSTAPMFFPLIVEKLGEQGLNRLDGAEVRVIIEKPFGTTLAEAKELNAGVLSVFNENQVFRIDHYLGKETVQNIMAFRFANGMFEPLWNRNYIANVQITAAVDIGIGTRAGPYDSAGALRDLIQNHMLQLLCHVAMEPPVDFSADEVRNEKVKVLHAIPPPSENDVIDMAVRGQYTRGAIGGFPVPGYLEEPGVPADSRTETYAAVRLEVDSWRWAGVPFYLRTGKRLARKVTEIAITLRPVPHLGFAAGGSVGVRPNQLILTLEPNESVTMLLVAKIPGERMRLRPVGMELLYARAFAEASPEAYETLLLDALRGEAMLFTRNDEVEAQWEVCDPILRAWATDPERPAPYRAGSQGPADAHRILCERDAWRAI